MVFKNHQRCQVPHVLEPFHMPHSVNNIPDLFMPHVFFGHLSKFLLQRLVAEGVVSKSMRNVNTLPKMPAVLGRDLRYPVKAPSGQIRIDRATSGA